MVKVLQSALSPGKFVLTQAEYDQLVADNAIEPMMEYLITDATIPQGEIGPEGPEGPQGPGGPQGEIGLTGPTGPQGPIGETGIQGIQGAQGVAGTAAQYMVLGASTTSIYENSDGSFTPSSVAVNILPFNTTVGTVHYSTTGGNDSQWSATPPAGVSKVVNKITIQASTMTANAIVIKAMDPTTDIYDVITISKIKRGLAGADGAQGIQGIQGVQGEQGIPGTEGAQGVKGDTGDQGASFNFQGVKATVVTLPATGSLGDAWLVTENGHMYFWDTVMGWEDAGQITGPQGLPGEQGIQGPQGEIGPEGPQGIPGEIGPQGPAGADGTDGATGAQGIQGEIGPQGIQGIQGEIGPEGPTGPAGDVSAHNLDGTAHPDLRAVLYNPSTLTVNTGTLTAGVVGDLTAVGGTDVAITEATGADPLRATLAFAGVARMNNVRFYGRYAGGSGHQVAVEIYNPNTTGWVQLGIIGSTAAKQWYSFEIFTPNDYISAGAVQVRFSHLGTGINTHNFYLDYVEVSDAGGGGSSFISASAIGANASGDLSGGTVQAQLTELDSEKMPKTGGTFTGAVVAPVNSAGTTAQVPNVLYGTADASGTPPVGTLYFKYTA